MALAKTRDDRNQPLRPFSLHVMGAAGMETIKDLRCAGLAQ
jgi:hypothetical protein